MEQPPPGDPRDPAEDETIVARDGWPVEDETRVRRSVRTEEAVPPPEPPPRPRPPLLWPGLLALLVLVLAALALAYALTRDDDEGATGTTTAARSVSVPDVVGTTSSEATAALRAAGLEVDLVPVPSDQPGGTVVAQDPAAGDEVDAGSRVRLNVARAAETTSAATTAPPPTTTAPPATTAPQPASVPDVVGHSLADAAEAFGEAGLKLSVVHVPSEEDPGTVVAQAQPPGTELEQGGTVQVNVSPGPEPAPLNPVPDVAGRKADEARDALEQARFEVLAIALQGGRAGIVSSQTPSAGARAPRGSLVVLYVGA